MSIRLIIHLSHHGLFSPMGWRKSEIKMQCSGQSKGRHEASFHPSIHLVIHPSRHDLFTPTGQRKSAIQTWHSGQMYSQIHTRLCISQRVQTSISRNKDFVTDAIFKTIKLTQQ
jgi:hypothetical protein